MPRPSTFLNPALGLLPGSISYALLCDLIACLPRPRPGASAAYARGFLQDTLAMLDAIAPRDRLEAAWAVQGVIFFTQARAVLARANAEADEALAERGRRHAVALQRRSEAMQALIERHRRTLAQDDLEHIPPTGWEYDLDALVAAWLDPAQPLPEAVLRVRPRGQPPFGVAAQEARRAAPVQEDPPPPAAPPYGRKLRSVAAAERAEEAGLAYPPAAAAAPTGGRAEGPR